MAIYTKKGDRGTTLLYGGISARKKYDSRVVAYGTVDELNAQIGVVLAFLEEDLEDIRGWLKEIQKDLFEIASELATESTQQKPFNLESTKVKELEKIIDKLEGNLPPLQNFIFPGGSKPGAILHIARTVCRRAEREIVKLSDKEEVNSNILVYLNRLSDCLFMLARETNRLEKSPEEIWKQK